MKVELVEQLEPLRGDEGDEDQRVRAEAPAPQVQRQREHQDGCQLEAAELGDHLEKRMERGLPQLVRVLRDLQVEAVEDARGDGDGKRDEKDTEDRDSDKARS